MNVGVLLSHPIQYHSPFFRRLSSRVEQLQVYYCTRHGVEATFDEGFGQAIKYDAPLLGGYQHEFLPNWAARPGPRTFGQVNPAVLGRVINGRHDALIVYSYAAVSEASALVAPRLRGTKVLLRGDSNPLPKRTGWRALVKQAVLRPLFARIDGFLAAGTRNAEYYKSFGVPERKIWMVPFAVDDEGFARLASEARPDRSRQRAAWGFEPAGPVFMFCGKLLPHKRPLDFVRALARLPRSARFGAVVVGSGELEPELRAEVARLGLEQRVRMVGFANQTELPAIYAACDALVVPSSVEPWGLVVNEAMACGLAIAASDHVGAAPDLVRDNGFVFPSGRDDLLAAGLAGWLAAPERLARAREASLDVIGHWSLARSVEATVEALHGVVESTR